MADQNRPYGLRSSTYTISPTPPLPARSPTRPLPPAFAPKPLITNNLPIRSASLDTASTANTTTPTSNRNDSVFSQTDTRRDSPASLATQISTYSPRPSQASHPSPCSPFQSGNANRYPWERSQRPEGQTATATPVEVSHFSDDEDENFELESKPNPTTLQQQRSPPVAPALPPQRPRRPAHLCIAPQKQEQNSWSRSLRLEGQTATVETREVELTDDEADDERETPCATRQPRKARKPNEKDAERQPLKSTSSKSSSVYSETSPSLVNAFQRPRAAPAVPKPSVFKRMVGVFKCECKGGKGRGGKKQKRKLSVVEEKVAERKREVNDDMVARMERHGEKQRAIKRESERRMKAMRKEDKVREEKRKRELRRERVERRREVRKERKRAFYGVVKRRWKRLVGEREKGNEERVKTGEKQMQKMGWDRAIVTSGMTQAAWWEKGTSSREKQGESRRLLQSVPRRLRRPSEVSKSSESSLYIDEEVHSFVDETDERRRVDQGEQDWDEFRQQFEGLNFQNAEDQRLFKNSMKGLSRENRGLRGRV